jgi:MscS family membrane protein
MLLRKRLLPCFILLVAMSLLLEPALFAQSGEQNRDTGSKHEIQEQETDVPKPPGGVDLKQLEEAMPIDARKIDDAGKALDDKIDAVTTKASVKYGFRWINSRVLGDVSWLKLIVCFGLILLVLAAERAVRRVISFRIEKVSRKAEPSWADLILEALFGPVSLFIQVYGFYWALSPIWIYFEGSGGVNIVHRMAGKAADIGGTVAIFWFIYRFVFSIDIKIRKWLGSAENGIHDMLVPLVSKTVRVFVLVVGGMLVIQNMTGIELGPLVASLGIGGLAFALAGKDSISNFLGSFTILLDKPFGVGDRVIIDKHDGFVEQVGFRSTRIRTLTGNLVSIPNERIISSTLENIARRSYLRWNTDLGLRCETPPEKVERAVRIVEEILEDHEGMRSDYPPRVHFNGFKDWSLNLSIFAWYFPPDFWRFQDWVQKTCIAIMRRFEDEGIEMAYPTQAVYQIEEEKADFRRARLEENLTAEADRGPGLKNR